MRTSEIAAQQTPIHETCAIDLEPPRRSPERRYKSDTSLAVNCIYVQHHSSNWPACSDNRVANVSATCRLLSARWIPVPC